jgi:3-hydroxybutyryl-CoA dehydrogenase
MISKAAVVGAGLMGTGIARHMASNNLEVTLLDKNESQLTTAREALSLPGVTTTTDFNVLSSADYVIEAVFEDISVKQEVLADIAKHTSPTCIIATNTSSLLIGDLASAVKHPNYFIGVHYNNPADFNPFVEIIVSNQTNESSIETIYQW